MYHTFTQHRFTEPLGDDVGKLHKIKRAFDKLPDARKRNLSKYSGVWYRDGDIRFGVYTNSYRRYVNKLCREYLGEVAQCDSVPRRMAYAKG